MPTDLPDFASEWIRQWKAAGPRLQAMRDEELRRRGREDGEGKDANEEAKQDAKQGADREDRALAPQNNLDPDRHGMVIMQRWFARRQLMEQNPRPQQAKNNPAAS